MMKISESELRENLVSARETPEGLRLAFSMEYPSGKPISVWIKENEGRWLASDMGMTREEMIFLDYDYDRNRRNVIRRLLSHYRAEERNGVLVKLADSPDEAMGLVYCIVAISSLIFSRKERLKPLFRREARTFLEGYQKKKDFELVTNYRVEGIHKSYRVHFAMRRARDEEKHWRAFLQTLYGASPETMNSRAEHIVAMWVSLRLAEPLKGIRRFVLIDDRERDGQIEKLRSYLSEESSGVFRWSEKESLVENL